MGDDEKPMQVLPNRFADAGVPGRDDCNCFRPPYRRRKFHRELQDTSAPGWLELLELVDEAAADGRTVFKPLAGMSPEHRRQIITLPETIAKLTAVEHLVLYGSNLVRIPPQIGAMSSLKLFEPYTSYRLHWFPYELTRCANLVDSTVSTRAIYGNYKNRLPFPELGSGVQGVESVRACSVCDGPVTELHQVWITRVVGTDALPLLVNACSTECVAALPTPAENYVPTPHTGGPDVEQPDAWR